MIDQPRHPEPIEQVDKEYAETQKNLGPDQQEAYALAQQHEVSRSIPARAGFSRQLESTNQLLTEAYNYFRNASKSELTLSYAAEWMLDNYYILQQTMRQIEHDLPHTFYQQLPRLQTGPLEGFPRIYDLARQMTRLQQARLDVDRVERFIDAYQNISALTIGELWAFPNMLRFTLLNSMALALSRITGLKFTANQTETEPVDLSPSVSDDDLVANGFMSLRMLASQDWKAFFEQLSHVEQILNQDPSGIYPGMDFLTRDQYRKIIEEIAWGSDQDELKVARRAVELADEYLDQRKIAEDQLQAHEPGDEEVPVVDPGWDAFQIPRQGHVGYYLLDEGRTQLEAACHFRMTQFQKVKRWFLRHNTPIYLGMIAFITILIVLLLANYAWMSGGGLLVSLIVLLIGVIPASTAAVAIANSLITRLVQPRVLPKMDFRAGIPEECRTLVVIPALFSSEDDIQSLCQELELHFLRNRDDHLAFALVTDFPDAHQEHMPGDDQLIQKAVEGIRQLNSKYMQALNGKGERSVFYLFHRQRKWNPKENSWMGWERKRGKLHELNQLLLRADDYSKGPTNRELLHEAKNNFSVTEGNIAHLAGIRYLITLDSDTVLPRDSARRLIATLAHPLNRAEFASSQLDPVTGETHCRQKVVAGYTVLQPRIEIKPTSANQSHFTQVFSGDTGLDLYTLAVSDVYQDYFGEGIYTGKGILDIRAFERSLEGCVPENALLSHDLFEGVHGRAGLVSDIILLEDYPPHYLVHILRQHRWVRGDWQLLPWLAPHPPSAEGHLKSNLLSLINRWKILDNLRRGLYAPSIFILMVAGWIGLPGSAWFWTAASISLLGVPFLISLITNLLSGSNERTTSQLLYSFRDPFYRWLFSFVFLPFEAQMNIDAVLMTLQRLYFSHRNLLQWTTAAESTRLLGRNLEAGQIWRQMAQSLFLCLSILLVTAVANPGALPAALPVLVVWAISPQVAAWISQPVSRQPQPLTGDMERDVRLLARRTWLFFEQFIGPEDHWLPPDHFQEAPLGTVAHRTSPTNIGLAFLTTLSAYDLGYIGLLDLITRLQSMIETLTQLERYRGHFLNWYDTRSLEVLQPGYVSTVDSGNLAASLIALGQGCLSLPEKPVLRWETFQGVIDNLLLIQDMISQIDPKGELNAVTDLYHTIDRMCQELLDHKDDPSAWTRILNTFAGPAPTGGQRWQELEARLLDLLETSSEGIGSESLRQLRIYIRQLRYRLDTAWREIELLQPWAILLLYVPDYLMNGKAPDEVTESWQVLFGLLPAQPTANEISDISQQARPALSDLIRLLEEIPASDTDARTALKWCRSLDQSLYSTELSIKAILIGVQEIFWSTGAYVEQMDFNFLFDEERQIFHIGYNLVLARLDPNYYDLLASEARIASLVAIAKGEVPQSHWLHMARPLARVDGKRALLSWSATMFEYLMPPLLMQNYEGTLLDQTIEAVIDHQIAYGRENQVPWGISESGYYRFDANLVYQYRAFGVPGLGFKRGLSEDLVITPYASLLALPFRPHAVVENIEKLEELGMYGTFGLYEAVDFTPARLSLGNKYQLVKEYMAHHQGMILMAINNYLNQNLLVRRFHADPCIQTVELLLQEKIPQFVPFENPHGEDGRAERPPQPKVVTTPWRAPVHSPQPRVHYLSNGRYGVMVTSSGSGYSAWKDLELTRWRADTTQNDWGTWIYITERGDDSEEEVKLWSAGFQPSGVEPASQDVFFQAHQVEFRRQDDGITTQMNITVSPEDDLELRLIQLTNESERPRRLQITSYGEVILSAQAADQRHPAFNKLFIENEWLPEVQGLLFRRRPRSDAESPVYLVHLLVTPQGQGRPPSFEGSRSEFLGRGGNARAPKGLLASDSLQGTAGATLDPIFAISQEMEVAPRSSQQLAFITLVGTSRQEALALARKYRSWQVVEREFNQANDAAEVELRQLGLSTPQLEKIQLLLSSLLYPGSLLRPPSDILGSNEKGQPGLWAYSISGDYPILVAHIRDEDQLPLVHDLLQAHTYWRNRQLKVDLVFVNEQGTDYGQALSGGIRRVIARMDSEAWINRRGGIFLLLSDQLNPQDRILLDSAARVVLDGERGSLVEQLDGLDVLPTRLPVLGATLNSEDIREDDQAVQRPLDLVFDNGLGGFSADGCEYVIYVKEGNLPPAPWINVIAYPGFGFFATESGLGYSWAVNSGENRLTPWNNDPVTDEPGEVLYLRDEETAEVWSPTPLPAGSPEPYLVRHGAGYTHYEHFSHGLHQQLRVFAAPDLPVKIIQLRIENKRPSIRRMTATFYAEWVLGTSREVAQQYLIPEYDGDTQALLVRNPYNPEFGGRIGFTAASLPLHGLTADRTEFLGRMGSKSRPAALERIGLSGTVRAGLDPCAALQVHLDLQPGEPQEIYFILGQAENRDEALQLVRAFKEDGRVATTWKAALEFWEVRLQAVQVKTPDPSMDFLLNQWLLYQAMSCRIWGRSAFYQSSGAYGFRDQLQDVMAVILADPEVARDHLLKAAAHQFEAGDVLHWWHPPSGRGVRTRFSDDLLWLPFVTAHYVLATGDMDVLNETVVFRKGPLLEPNEEERYGFYQPTQESFTLYEHCLRAIERGTTSGRHGLPLMGTGDWNDGMNRVGAGGQGESVWLGWFLYATLEQFARVSDMRGSSEQADLLRQRAQKLAQAIEEAAWDGQWYRRAYYDDGSPLGSAQNRECQIDSIAQSWSVLSEAGDPQRARQAMQSVLDRLVLPEEGLILLFTPPFNNTPRDPGYIKGYLPGIRENGGQYTHAALWSIWALAQLGDGDQAFSLFQLINPILHADTRAEMEEYKVEPYVIAADVYGVPPHVGRGGWTWYTGSSGWMYRLGIEAILGIRRTGKNNFVVDPCIPHEWQHYEITLRLPEANYSIRVENPHGVNRGVRQVFLDGNVLEGLDIPILTGGQHHQVRVILGPAEDEQPTRS